MSKTSFFFFPLSVLITLIFSQQELDPQTYNEVKRIYQMIKDNGQQGDYAVQLTFGELVPVKNIITKKKSIFFSVF